jgi:hypothetical protein
MDKKEKRRADKSNASRTRTQLRKQAVIEALQKSLGIVSTACISAGINRSTFYEWVKNDPDFAKAVEEVEDFQLDYVEGKLLQNVKSNDTQSIIFYLKCKGGKRGYGEKHEVKVELPQFNDHRTNEEIEGIFKARMQMNGEK